MEFHRNYINEKGKKFSGFSGILPNLQNPTIQQVRSDDSLFLDIKVGNLLQQNVIRVQTEQAHEISRIMRQYITLAQKTGQRE